MMNRRPATLTEIIVTIHDIRKQKASGYQSPYVFTQGSVLDPILFSTYINDMTNHTEDICRLYADDTFLRHYINVLQHLQQMAYSGFSNIKKWREDSGK